MAWEIKPGMRVGRSWFGASPPNELARHAQMKPKQGLREDKDQMFGPTTDSQNLLAFKPPACQFAIEGAKTLPAGARRGNGLTDNQGFEPLANHFNLR
jgi:hypothetical protein